jgi:hypothetical protein
MIAKVKMAGDISVYGLRRMSMKSYTSRRAAGPQRAFEVPGFANRMSGHPSLSLTFWETKRRSIRLPAFSRILQNGEPRIQSFHIQGTALVVAISTPHERIGAGNSTSNSRARNLKLCSA